MSNSAAATPSVPVLTSPVRSNAVPAGPTDPSAFSERNLQAQAALVRHGISSGSLDGVIGSQTRRALRAFQQQRKLPNTGALDNATCEQLLDNTPLTTEYTLTGEDLARLLPVGNTWLAKSQQERLDYETALELIAEKSQSHPNLIRRLNPGISWSNVTAGTVFKIPKAEFPPITAKAAFIKVSLGQRTLEAFDQENKILAHFPCSIGQKMEQRPVGELCVTVRVLNPNYTFDPEIFPESEEARSLGQKLFLRPGPNNPVGTVWIGLDKPGYGIHGTPRPEQVGRTESHGCFRLANWNAEFLAKMVWVGMPVLVGE